MWEVEPAFSEATSASPVQREAQMVRIARYDGRVQPPGGARPGRTYRFGVIADGRRRAG